MMLHLATTGLTPLPLTVLFLIFTALISVFSAQWVATGTLEGAIRWMRRQFPVFLLSIPAVSAIPLLITALTNRFWPGFTLGYFLVYVVAKADQVKYETALTHFLWSDLFKTSDPGKFRELIGHYIRPAFFLPMLLGQVLGNGLIVLASGGIFLVGQGAVIGRILAALAGTGLLVLFWRYGHWVQNPGIRKWLRLPVISSQDYTQNVRLHGTWLAFFAHIHLVAIDQDAPDVYTPEKAELIQSRLMTFAPKITCTPANQGPTPAPSPEKPTLIVLAVEALWDITRIPGLEFSADPLQALRTDYAGDVTASCFAGLTANSEFEFLTGLSIALLHDSACPFIKITHPLPALPAHLRQLGYQTTAIHSYTRTFYDRDKVYPLLGFEQFNGLEELTEQGYARQKGWYVADEALLEPILAQLHQNENPQLIYTLTMQNHGPYAPQRYAPDEIEPQVCPQFPANLNLSEGDRQAVINYTQGVRDSAKLYQSLCQHIEQLDRPVLLLAFGDHLPGIGEHSGYRIMVDAGMAASPQDPALYQVPVFYHANQSAQHIGLPANLALDRTVQGQWPGFNVLGARLLEAAGLPLPELQHLVLDLARSDQAVQADQAVLITEKSASSLSREDLLKTYEWLQYDWLWGQGYTLPK
ncbi:MAG: sulfatase-like hydrolase/transferase [Eubacteriales bacterium]|nr:sulfatase-like hydrolase/transferase [Eubacteriales bacterium]